MNQSVELTEKECPECKALIVVHPGYVTWCQQCNWNIRPLQPDPPSNLFEKFYASLGQRQSKALHESISKRTSSKPTWSLAQVLAYLISLVTHCLTLGLFILGVWLLIFGIPDFLRVISIFGGVMSVGLAWVLRPRFGKLPEKNVLTQDQAPKLHQLVNRIADSLSAKPVDYILILPEFNAFFGRAGWQGKRILGLGLPLLSCMNDEERVALIGHELAHDVNGDSARTLFVQWAIDSLIGWYAIIWPERLWLTEMGLRGLFMIPFNLVLRVIAGIGWVGAFLLSQLLWRDSQRAEYYADYRSAEVSGTKAALSALEKMHFGSTFLIVLQWVALRPELREENLFVLLRERVETVPAVELERINRVQQMELSRLNVTHPPTTYRIDALRAHPVEEVKVRVSPAESAAIQKELALVEPDVQKKLVELRRAGYFVY